MSVQHAISPHKQLPSKHSPKLLEKIKASPSKKVILSELYGIPSTNTNKKLISLFPPFVQYFDYQQSEQKVVQDGDNSKNTSKNGVKPQQTIEKNGAKKSQISQKATTNSKQLPVNQSQAVNGNCGNGSIVSNKQKCCFNLFCSKDKCIVSGISTQQEASKKQAVNGSYKQLKLEKTGEKVSFCDLCCVRYQERHFCYFCQQVYFDEYNIDEKDWIQCDSCDRWCHLNCEDDKIKKAFSNSQCENVQYECPRCRGKEITIQTQNSAQQQVGAAEKVASTSKQTQNNLKIQKEKGNQAQVVGVTKVKKQGKIKEKEDKKQDQAETQNEKHVNGFQNGQTNTLVHQQFQINSQPIQSQRIESIKQGSIKKGTIGLGSTNRDNIQQQNQNDQEIYYSLDNFKMKKNKIFSNQQQMPQLYQPIQPLTLLPNYSTIDDLLKSSGISTCLDENSIKNDINYLKKILMESSDTSYQSNCSINNNKNKVQNHLNGQNNKSTVNQD